MTLEFLLDVVAVVVLLLLLLMLLLMLLLLFTIGTIIMGVVLS